MGKFEDLTGQQFGKLTVLYRSEDYVQPSGQHKRVWHCLCSCGNECDIRAVDLKSGNTKSCGCFQQSSRGKNNFKDLTGKVFGKLTVLYRLPNHVTPSGQTKSMWRCKCECGNECDIYASQLFRGKKSCGCMPSERKRQKEQKQKYQDKGKEKNVDSIETPSENNAVNEIKVIEKARIKEEKARLREEKAKAREIEKARIKEEKARFMEEKAKAREIKKEQIRKEKAEILLRKSLASNYPELIEEWNYVRNRSVFPESVTPGSEKKSGGFVQRAMNGKQQLVAESEEIDALIVPIRRS